MSETQLTDELTTREQCQEAISLRWRQVQDCVGWLYPSILRSEIEKITNRMNSLPHTNTVVVYNPDWQVER